MKEPIYDSHEAERQKRRARTALNTIVLLVGASVVMLVAIMFAPQTGKASDQMTARGLGPECVSARTVNPDFDPDDFVRRVNHPYFPLTPGTTYIYEGETEDGFERVKVSVLSRTKKILGITATVVRDTVWIDGELVEDTFDWFAQDEDGNVWYLGEAVKDYENGEVVSTAGSWEAGVDGAKPGIIMLAHPKVGDTYRQEYYVGEAEDMAQVINLNASVSVPYGSFRNVLVTRECTPLEPGVAENKYYARGVGLILGVKVEGGSGQIELVDIIKPQRGNDDND